MDELNQKLDNHTKLLKIPDSTTKDPNFLNPLFSAYLISGIESWETEFNRVIRNFNPPRPFIETNLTDLNKLHNQIEKACSAVLEVKKADPVIDTTPQLNPKSLKEKQREILMNYTHINSKFQNHKVPFNMKDTNILLNSSVVN
jgi:hypothetical protein